MPKAHRLANQATHFAISPWQCKRKQAGDESRRGDYRQVVVALPQSRNIGNKDTCTEGPAAGLVSAERSPIQPWRSKRRKTEDAVQPQQKDGFDMQHVSTPESAANATLPRPRHLHAQIGMSGLGYVAVLPDGQCIGAS